MDPFLLPITISSPEKRIHYPERILLTGSCFTEHIGNELGLMKFNTLTNPNGILFDPLSVARSLTGYLEAKTYVESDLFYGNELWQSWDHHGRYSDISPEQTLANLNSAHRWAREFLAEADWVIITLGSAYTYFLKEGNRPVANCHRAPQAGFDKRLLPVETILAAFDETLHRLRGARPNLQVIFTVSPVRHIRDGVIENNRSKARLLESVHALADKFASVYYFPAYELVIDVLRDYRFYDKDLVHPNYQATSYVLERFMENYLERDSRLLAEQMRKLNIARRHRPMHPGTAAHRKFLKEQLALTSKIQERYPFLSLGEEIAYFGQDAQL